MAEASQKGQVSGSSIVVASTIGDKPYRRPVLFGIVVVAIILLAGLSYQHWHKATPTIERISAAQHAGNYRQAISLTKKAIDKASTPIQKANLYTYLGNNYVNDGQIDQGIAAYKSAAKTRGMTANLAYLIATNYLHSHKSQQAIKYYQQAIKLWPKNDPLYQAQVNSFQQDISALRDGSTE